MTKTERDELVERALREHPPSDTDDGDCLREEQVALSEVIVDKVADNSTEHDIQAGFWREMLSMAIRGARWHEQRARHLRANEAHAVAKRDGKRICKNCRAVEGDGRQGCIETFPPQHKWVTL